MASRGTREANVVIKIFSPSGLQVALAESNIQVKTQQKY